jgi:hypothetical protein
MFTNTNRPSAVDVLRPFVSGDMFYADSTTTLAKLPIGSETQVLNVATGIPTWTSTITLSGLTVTDSLFNIVGNVDPTKRLNFQTDSQATLSRLTFDVGAQTADRTLTVPVLTGNATLATLSETQTFTGAKTFSATITGTKNGGGIAGAFLAESASIPIGYAWNFTGGGADAKVWDVVASTNTLSFRTRDDAATSSATWLTANRSGNSVTSAAFGSSTILTVANTTDSTTKDTGSIVTEGGVGIEKSLYVGGAVDVTSTVTAANYFRCNRTNFYDTTYSTFFTGCSTFPFFFDAKGGMNWGDGTNPVDTILYRNIANQIRTDDQFYVSITTDATTKDTGSIITEGGIGVEKAIVTGTSITAGTTLTANGTTDSTSTTTGTVITTGGIGFGVTKSLFGGGIKSTSATLGIGYATGAGGTQTQATSRTTTVTLDKICGAITLFSAAGSATYTSFTLSNSTIAATDTIILNQKSGTDKYILLVTAVAAGSCQITFATTGGTTVEQPVFNFSVIKAVAA